MVHDVWSTMFNWCYKTVFLRINFKIKGWGSTMVPPFGGNTAFISNSSSLIYYHPFLLLVLSAPPLSLSHLLYSLCSPFRACVSHPFLFLQIYTIFLTSASIALEGDSEKSPQDWLKGLENGINAIKRYGGADIGDRTMVTTYNYDNYKYYNNYI